MESLNVTVFDPEAFEMSSKLLPVSAWLFPSQNDSDPTIEVETYCLEEKPDCFEPTLDPWRRLAKVVLTLGCQSRTSFAIFSQHPN